MDLFASLSCAYLFDADRRWEFESSLWSEYAVTLQDTLRVGPESGPSGFEVKDRLGFVNKPVRPTSAIS